jgi:hypothetical protein
LNTFNYAPALEVPMKPALTPAFALGAAYHFNSKEAMVLMAVVLE